MNKHPAVTHLCPLLSLWRPPVRCFFSCATRYGYSESRYPGMRDPALLCDKIMPMKFGAHSAAWLSVLVLGQDDYADVIVRNNFLMERKRSLPLWMLGVTAADKERGSNSKKQEEDNKEAPSASGSVVPDKDSVSSHGDVDDINRNVTHHIVKRFRKSNMKDRENRSQFGGNNDTCDRKKKNKTKEMRGDRDVKILKKRSRIQGCDSLGDSEMLTSAQADGHGIKLTVDDLVSIAEEYVKADARKCKAVSATVTTSNNVSQTPSHTHEPPQRFSTNADFGTKSSTENETLRPRGIGSSIEAVSRDDVVGDLLNIFLGSAIINLRKDMKHETEDYMAQGHESSARLNSMDNKDEEAPLMKKKGSLKEKVTTLLDKGSNG